MKGMVHLGFESGAAWFAVVVRVGLNDRQKMSS